jgi:hydroxymethylpyrimidine pyrophosphatase-like HAD family hydrolase
MSDKKILFLDVDGTLIDYETKITFISKEGGRSCKV